MSEHISETKELTCIGCPLGCAITVTLTDGTVSSVTGNTCPRGDAYARKEVTNPTRIVTTTVRVKGGVSPMVNVKTASDLPKPGFLTALRHSATWKFLPRYISVT